MSSGWGISGISILEVNSSHEEELPHPNVSRVPVRATVCFPDASHLSTPLNSLTLKKKILTESNSMFEIMGHCCHFYIFTVHINTLIPHLKYSSLVIHKRSLGTLGPSHGHTPCWVFNGNISLTYIFSSELGRPEQVHLIDSLA